MDRQSQRGPHEERGEDVPAGPAERQTGRRDEHLQHGHGDEKERAHGGRVVDEVLDLRVAREQQHGIECSHDAQHETGQHRQRDGPRASPIGPLPQRPVQADEQQAQQAAQEAQQHGVDEVEDVPILVRREVVAAAEHVASEGEEHAIADRGGHDAGQKELP
ncbi:hypothetical protein AOA80_03145 [Methanomassiliicoccales archaeon RumEn M1]|nr:hypothetical protein AOA80_03145 [Methanomassiliicoccales archaeon RumEn M1]